MQCEQCHVVGLEGDKKYKNCNQECARCMSCRTFPTPSLNYHIPIPRDFYTLTHQPEYHPYYPADYRNTTKQNCTNCNDFYLADHKKQVCFECERQLVNAQKCPKTTNPMKKFFYDAPNAY
jgi:hypothetical protein